MGIGETGNVTLAASEGDVVDMRSLSCGNSRQATVGAEGIDKFANTRNGSGGIGSIAVGSYCVMEGDSTTTLGIPSN